MKRRLFVCFITALISVFSAFALSACVSTSDDGKGDGPFYETDTVTVTYDANGGEFDDGNKIYSHKSWKNSMLTQPGSPSRANYDFVGWTKTRDGEDLWRFDADKVTESVTLYAAWEAEVFTVAVSGNYVQAGTVEGGGDYGYGEEVTVTAIDEGNLGYTFVGWFNGDKLLTDKLSYTFGMPAENVSYTAEWRVDAAMSNFYFHSTATTCVIDGIIDEALTEITVPDFVTAIGNYAFFGCNSLESASLGEGVTSIGERAFSGCGALQSLTLGKSLNQLGMAAFKDCKNLSVIRFNGGFASWFNIERLSDLTYQGTNNRALYIDGSEITGELAIPYGVTSICEGAFYNCRGLTKLTVPDSVTTIGYKAFCGCDGLTELTIPFVGRRNGDTEYDHMGYVFGASYNYIAYQYVPQNLRKVIVTGNTVIRSGAFIGCRALTCVVLGDGITSVGSGAFSDSEKLSCVVLGRGIVSVGRNAFRGSNITGVYYRGSEEEWANVEVSAEGNESLTGAPLYFYSEEQPVREGNFWHYGEDGETPEKW